MNHLELYPLLTQKWADYQLFKQALDMVIKKEHLTMEGLLKVLAIKAAMNGNGLSDKLTKAFPNLIPVNRPRRNECIALLSAISSKWGVDLVNQKIYDPSWLAGFIDGEGCFFIRLRQSSSYRLGYQVSLRFQITQHIRDKLLLLNIVDYLGCGRYSEVVKNVDGKFEVEGLKDIVNIIIPYLDKYPLQGIKHKDYLNFKEVANLMGKVYI